MNYFKIAYKSLKLRRLRSFLTMLGVIIGVFSVYMMLTIAYGVSKSISDLTSSINAHSISIYSRQKPFTESALKALGEIENVRLVNGVNSKTVNVTREDETLAINVISTDVNYIIRENIEVFQGHNISVRDLQDHQAVAVIGQDTSKTLFGNSYPIGQTLKINGVPVRVIGIGKRESPNGGFNSIEDPNNFVIIPRSTGRSKILGQHKTVRDHVKGIAVVFDKSTDMSWANYRIETTLRQLRQLPVSKKSDFKLHDFSQFRRQAEQVSTVLAFLLGAIGAISLLVGGIGVMNIMLVSVTERTREIGIRMAVGARKSDILFQFIIESLLLCGLAGAIGLGLGWGCCQILNLFDAVNLELSPKVALLSFSSAMVVGLVFGVMPARRAANLKPVEALKHV